MISIFGQFSGNGLGYFNATIFEQIGVKSVSQQLAYNLLNSVLSAVVSTLGSLSCSLLTCLGSIKVAVAGVPTPVTPESPRILFYSFP